MAVAMAFRRRARTNSLTAATPPRNTVDYDPDLEHLASQMLYKSPLPSPSDLPLYVLDSAAFPDTQEVNYDALLPYVLARLPTEEELIGSRGYEIVFFAGGEETAQLRSRSGTTGSMDSNEGRKRRNRPGWSWLLQAYHVLSRAMRKRLQCLYLVHERRWVRVAAQTFSTIVSPKFRRKQVHCSTLSDLALHLPVEDLLIPPSAYDRDRRVEQRIYSPYATGRRAFGATKPLPVAADGSARLPRVLRETTTVLLDAENVETEGLFRVNARMQTLDILKEAYDRGQKFIVWREGDRINTFDEWKEGHGEISVGKVDQLDGYGVHTAAGLTKLWYSSLREPLFPQASYPFLSRMESKDLELPVLMDLISTTAEWSPLSHEAQLILTMHLFPMLARISQHSEQNKMNASNLSRCIAPALLCGPDPFEDAKMTMIVAKIIQYAVENWDSVADSCGMGNDRFSELLKIPAAPIDREDPLSGTSTSSPPHGRQQSEGIVLLDEEDSDTSEETDKPPLPPRVSTQTTAVPVPGGEPPAPTLQTQTTDTPSSLEQPPSAIRRKPAPPLQNPPRYSTLVTSPQQDHGDLPSFQGLTMADRKEPMNGDEDDK